MIRKAMKSSLALTIIGVLLLAYTNCSQPKVTDVGQNPYDTLSNASKSGMSLSPANTTISWGQKVQMEVEGGVAPYYYRLRAGGGSIDYYSGLYTAPSIDTDAVIEVEDTAGAVAQTRVFVNLSSSSALSLSHSPASLTVGTEATLSASGGTSPYSYFMVSGVGNVSGNKFSASSFGTAVIGVRDATGLQSTFNVQVGSTVTLTTRVIYRLYHATGKQFLFSKTKTEGTSSGFKYEAAAFNVLTTQPLSSAKLSRCYIASSGGRFLSITGCGAYTDEGELGYIYTYAATNTVPLYSCFKDSTGTYLFSTDYNSCINNGFNVKGSAPFGYVPK